MMGERMNKQTNGPCDNVSLGVALIIFVLGFKNINNKKTFGIVLFVAAAATLTLPLIV